MSSTYIVGLCVSSSAVHNVNVARARVGKEHALFCDWSARDITMDIQRRAEYSFGGERL